MTVIVHDASSDKQLLQHTTFRPCPFCGSETVRVCATPSSCAIACDNRSECGAEIYIHGPAALAIERWNRRTPTER